MNELIELRLEERLDVGETLRLTIPATSAKQYLIGPDLEFEHDGRRYYVVEKQDDRRGAVVTTTADLEALWYRLGAEAQPGTVVIADATPSAGVAAILTSSSWSVGTASSSATATYSLTEDDRSTLELLRTWAKVTGRHIRFDTVNQVVDIVDTAGADLGLAFRYRRNVRGMRRRARAPAVTRLYAYGANDLTIAGQTGGDEYVEDLSYYTAKGLTADQAAELYARSRIWVDTSFVDDVELYAAALARLAELSQEVVSYELDAIDLDELSDGEHYYSVGDTVRVYDPDIAVDDAGDPVDLRGIIVRTVKFPLEPWRNEVEVAFRPPTIADRSASSARTGTGDAWFLFTGPVGSSYQVRNDGTFTVGRIPLRFAAGGAAHIHLALRITGIGSGIATVRLWDGTAGEQVHLDRDVAYTDGAEVYAAMTLAHTALEGTIDYRVRVTVASTGGSSNASGVNLTEDADGIASFYILAQNAVREAPVAANSQQFDVTGAVQTFTVPDNVTEITLDVAGGGGGEGHANPTTHGGRGTRVVAAMPVTPGENLDLYVGGAGHDGDNDRAGGWPNGGNGGDKASSGVEGGGGGGSSDVRRAGAAFVDAIIVAGGGGGGAADPYAGGDAGFYEGLPGVGSAVEIFGAGAGAQGATQFAGGAGEDLDVYGTDGDAGTFNAGADGKDVSAFRDPGGGGGGGRYGGGAGGSPGATVDAAGGGGGGSGWLDDTAGLTDITIDDTFTPGGEAGGDGRIIVAWDDPL